MNILEGLQWSAEEQAEMAKTGRAPLKINTITGRMASSGPAIQNLPKSPAVEVIDRELLDRLAQPTPWAKIQRRRVAMQRYVQHSTKLAKARLAGWENIAAHFGKLVEQYRDLYQFTKEEIDAYIEKTDLGA